MFWTQDPDFDSLAEKLNETDRSQLLGRYLHCELAHAWLAEKGISFSVSDLLELSRFIHGKG
ncbi:MAG: hypothetical protein PHY16_16525 [Methylobacter sp.]|nr:hypothetical protein [Methylobacter sp.]